MSVGLVSQERGRGDEGVEGVAPTTCPGLLALARAGPTSLPKFAHRPQLEAPPALWVCGGHFKPETCVGVLALEGGDTEPSR